MSEYIKKEDAIRHFQSFEKIMKSMPLADVKARLKDLPTYSFPDSDENKGEWIYKNPFDTLPYCSKCDKEPNTEFLGVLPNTCPNCGADMRGKAE